MSVDKWAYNPEKCDGAGCVGDCDLCPKANEPAEADEDEWTISQDDAGMVTIRDYQGSVHAQFIHEPLKTGKDKQRLLKLWLWLMKDAGDLV